MPHRRQHDMPCCYSVSLGMMMLELVANVGCDCVQPMIRQLGPDTSCQGAGAEMAEARLWQMKVVEGLLQNVHVEAGVVCDDDVGARQPLQKLCGDLRELRGMQDIQMRDAVNLFCPLLKEPTMALGRLHQPVGRLHQHSVLKDRHTGCAHAGPAVVRGFKVDAGDLHGVRGFAGKGSFPKLFVKPFVVPINGFVRTPIGKMSRVRNLHQPRAIGHGLKLPQLSFTGLWTQEFHVK